MRKLPSTNKPAVYGTLTLLLTSDRTLSRKEICDQLNLPNSTATRYLFGLSESGDIQKTGSARATVYSVDAADAYLSKKMAAKTKRIIPYDFERFRQVSGVSSFFTDEQKSRLMQYGMPEKAITHSDYLELIHRKLLIEASWASSSLEGNTYSLIDTKELFESGVEMPGAKFEETRMLVNHKHAIEYVLKNINAVGLTRRDALNIHSLLSEDLMSDPLDVGRLRQKIVGIGQSSYVPLSVPSMIEEEIDVLFEKAKELLDPFDRSFFVLINIAYLQPFTDVNKRTSRMMSNIPLLQDGLMPMSFFQMSKTGYEKGMLHYYETGDFRRLAKEYVNCYEVSAQRFREILGNKPTQEESRLRLKYRKEISAAVFEVVKSDKDINDMMPEGASQSDRDFFLNYTQRVIDALNEGNSILYKLTEDDVIDYKKSHSKKAPSMR